MFPLETFPQHLESIRPKDWHKLFQYLPELEGPENFGDWRLPVSHLRVVTEQPWVVPSRHITNVLHAFYELELIISFDWGAWAEGSRRLAQDPFFADDLDAVTICKMITGIVRSDRFNDGTLVNAFEDGRMTTLLKALEDRVCPQ